MSDPNDHPMRPRLAPPSEPVPSVPSAPNPWAGITAPYRQTPPGAPTDEPYAHWWRRAVATLLDAALLIPFYFAQWAGLDAINDAANSGDTQLAGFAVVLVATIGAAWFSIWNSILRQGRTGSSLGKLWLDITVISQQDGRPIGGWMTFLRQIMHVLDAIPCYLGYFWPLWDKRRQTFSDKVMNTVVLHLPPLGP